MRAICIGTLVLASCGAPSHEKYVRADLSSLSNAYGEMRDARVCAALDSRTTLSGYWIEVERTEKLVFEGWGKGLGEQLSEAKAQWEADDAVSDKICPFQTGNPPATPSLELFKRANDALKAAIAAEAN